MSEPNKERIQLLVDELRTTEHQQARNALSRHTRNGGTSYCCLGIACEIAIANGLEIEKSMQFSQGNIGSGMGIYDEEMGSLPPSVQRWYGFDKGNPYLDEHNTMTAAEYNDGGMSFPDIADKFEEKFLKETTG